MPSPRVAAILLLSLPFSMGCGQSGDPLLGEACLCEDGSAQCFSEAECGDSLSCVVGRCALSCASESQDDCPEEFQCTAVTDELTGLEIEGTWCRPLPTCLAAAGLDGASLLAASSAVGDGCDAPASGAGSVEGTVLEQPFPSPEAQDAYYSALDPDAAPGTMIHIGADLAVSEDSTTGRCTTTLGGVAMTVVVPCGALRLGAHPVGNDPAGAETTVEVVVGFESVHALGGSITFDGYDPATGSLCGSLDITLDDGSEGGLVGTFRAAAYCAL